MPIATFSLTMMALYIVFIDPNRIHRFMDRIHGVEAKP